MVHHIKGVDKNKEKNESIPRPLTFDSVTLGNADDVHHFILREDVLDRNSFLHQAAGKVDFFGNRTAIQLDLVDVGLLLTLTKELDLE